MNHMVINGQYAPEEKMIMEPCPDCDCDGEMLSDCCGVPGKSNGDGCTEDYGICPECGDHCTYSACETCGGSGEVEMSEDELQDMKDAEGENKYQTDKEENEPNK